MVLDLSQHGDKRRRDVEAAGGVAEVERHVGPDQVRAVGRLEAVAEHLDPLLLAHPPERIAGEDLVRVDREAALCKPAGDILAERREVRVDVAGFVGEREAVLLIRPERQLAPCGAAEGQPRPRHGRRASLVDREVDQPACDRVGLKREHAGHVDRRDAGAEQREEQRFQPLRALDQLVDASRLEQRMAECEWTAHLEAGEIGSRENAEHTAGPVDDHDVVGSGVEHVHDRVHCSAVGVDLDGRLDDAEHRVLDRDVAGGHALAQDRVRQDRDAVPVLHQDRRRVVLGHRLGRLADRDASVAEHGRPGDELRDPGRAELRQGVHDVTGLDEPVAQGCRDVPCTRGPREHLERPLAWNEVARRLLARPHRERRREPGQQRRVPEALPGLEHVDDLALVHQLHAAVPDDEQMLGGRRVLDERVLAGRVARDGRRRGNAGQDLGVERVERGIGGQKRANLLCVHCLHCSRSIAVAAVTL